MKPNYAKNHSGIVEPVSRNANSTAKFWFLGLALATASALFLGAFGTNSLPLVSRVGLWTVLMGLNGAKWYLWWRFFGQNRYGPVATLVSGAIILNLSIPFEVRWAIEQTGRPLGVSYLELYAPTAAFSVIIGGAIFLLRHLLTPSVPAGPEPQSLPRCLRTAGVLDIQTLLAVEAEDHYVALRMRDGKRRLVYYRFRDAVEELSAIPGGQVNRSTWIATNAVVAVHKSGRNVNLELTDGSQYRVTNRYVEGARKIGWL